MTLKPRKKIERMVLIGLLGLLCLALSFPLWCMLSGFMSGLD